MFNGWRHMLFAFPPVVVIAALGWDGLINSFSNKIVKWIILILFAGLFTKTSWWVIKNHPNEYVYYNELVGGVDGAYGNYETDPYGNCMRAATEWLIKNEHLEHKKTLVIVNQETLTASYYANELSDSVTISWSREYELGKQRWDYALLTTRTMTKNLIKNSQFPPKGTIHVMTVDNTPLVAIVKRENYFMPDGYTYFDKARFDSAEICFRKAIENDPKNEECYRMLAATYLSKGNYSESEKLTETVLSIYPESFIAHYFKGLIRFNQKRYAEALPFLEEAIALKINYADPYYLKGKIYVATNDFQRAITAFELAYKHGGQNYKILNDAAVAYFMYGDAEPVMQKTYYQKGMELLSESLKKNPNQREVYHNLGFAYGKLGNTKASQECYKKEMSLAGGQ